MRRWALHKLHIDDILRMLSFQAGTNYILYQFKNIH